MSSKQEETASEIPAILHDVNNKTKYERLRFFGKVTTFPYFSSFVFFRLFYCTDQIMTILCIDNFFCSYFFLVELLC